MKSTNFRKHFVFFFINFILSVGLISYLILGILEDYLFLFFLIVPIIIAIIFNVNYFKFIKKQERNKKKLEREISNDNKLLLEKSTTEIGTKGLDSASNEDKMQDWDTPIILVDIFVDSTKNQKCAICKLSFNENDTILQCKICLSLFHKEHLKKWLVANNFCPVCSSKMKIR